MNLSVQAFPSCFSQLSSTNPTRSSHGVLGCTSTSEVVRSGIPAPVLPGTTHTTWLLALNFGLDQPFQIMLRHCLGDSQAREHSQVVIMDKAFLFWEGKGRESSQMDANRAMYFLPSWPTVPVVQGFPESELESFWEFDCSQLLYIPWICPNACEIHGKLLHPSHPLASSSTVHFSVINTILKCKW